MKRLIVIVSAVCIGMFALGCSQGTQEPADDTAQVPADDTTQKQEAKEQETPQVSENDAIKAYLENPATMAQFVSDDLQDYRDILYNSIHAGDVESALEVSKKIAQISNDFLKVECPPACDELHELMQDYYREFNEYASFATSAADSMSVGSYDIDSELEEATKSLNNMTSLTKEIAEEYQRLYDQIKQ